MAKRTQVTLEDDLDGGLADQTVDFAVRSVSYEIDLSSGNADRLIEALAPFVQAGRRVPSRSSRAAGGARARGAARGATGTDPARLKSIRDWARDNGRRVSDRGRVPAAVVAAFETAHE